jgi:hypothetical protein
MDDQIKAIARDIWACDDIGVDEDARVIEVEEGHWVSAWVWVPREVVDAAPLPNAAECA